MTKLRRLLGVLFCAALLFLLHYAWLRPPTKFATTNSDNLFKTHGEGITWQRYRGDQIVQQVKAAKATVFFAAEMPNDKSELESEHYKKRRSTYLDLGASPARVELQGGVLFASDGHVLRTTHATFANGKMFSDAVVQIEGGRMRLHGHDGFSYVLADGQLTLLGEVEGEAYPADDVTAD